MGTEYEVYTVGTVHGKRKCLNGYVFNDKGDKKLTSTYWNGSRTYFSNTYQKLYEIGSRATAASIPDNLKEAILDNQWEGYDINESEFLEVSLSDILKVLPKDGVHDMCGFFSHESLLRVEFDGLSYSDAEYIDTEQYAGLSKGGQKQYKYIEWDDDFGWLKHLRKIVSLVQNDIDMYEDATGETVHDAGIIVMRN